MTPALSFLLAAVAASATMVGWAIAVSGRAWPPRLFGVTLLLVAAAMVLISCIQLLPGAIGSGLSVAAAVLWAVAGGGVVVALQSLARLFGLGQNGLARSAVLIAVTMGLHNIPEGAATAATALISVQGGIVTAVAVGLHNVPEGIAVAAPVLASGGSRARAFWFTGVAAGGEVLGAALALAFAETLTQTRVGGLLALVAGLMITLSVVELAPSGIALLRRGGDSVRPRDSGASPMQ